MDTLGFDVEETKGENPRGSGYWEATQPTGMSLFCPRACGCHRGDQDCPTTCPERDASDPLCPAWQEQILPGPIYKDACPRLPAAQPFDPGDGEDAETAVG